MHEDQFIQTLKVAQRLLEAESASVDHYVMEFTRPVSFIACGRDYHNTQRFRFTSCQLHEGRLYFATRKRARMLRTTSIPLDAVSTVYPVKSDPTSDAFSSYEEFARQFDLRFISAEKVHELWVSGSSQHGGPFRRSDFKPLSKRGKEVMERFLREFVSWDQPAGERSELIRAAHRSDPYNLRGGFSTVGRDITIEHRAGNQLVFYSSEFPGCGNGSYYIVAKANKILHMEND